jgi:hypothetical protein
VVAADDALGNIRFTGADGTGFIEAARIRAEVDGTPGTNDMPGRLVFFTTADGASSPTERMRIANNGAISTVVPGGSTLYPAYDCRAWVNFNGTGTVSIRGNGNVSSITDHGTGEYTVNFTNAMPDTNYAVAGSSSGDSGSLSGITVLDGGTYSTSAMRFLVRYAAAGNGLVDRATVAIQIFR